jgi:hypothetical protein
MSDYPKEKLDELYENLPVTLRDSISSSENANIIYNICTKNNITEEDIISKIAKNTCYVLLGILPPNKLKDSLLKELQLKNDAAEQITSEINDSIFLSVKEDLESLYNIKMKQILQTIPSKNAEPEKIKRKDSYREPIE